MPRSNNKGHRYAHSMVHAPLTLKMPFYITHHFVLFAFYYFILFQNSVISLYRSVHFHRVFNKPPKQLNLFLKTAIF